MSRDWVHTVHKEGNWVVEIEGHGVTSVHRNKDEAVSVGRELAIARRTEHVIHNLDGTIAGRNSYGNDPFPPAG